MVALSALKEKISKQRFMEVVAISIAIGDEDVAVAAYGESNTPSVVLTHGTFEKNPNSNQNMKFRTIFLKGYEGYKIWSCEIVREEMRICLVK